MNNEAIFYCEQASLLPHVEVAVRLKRDDGLLVAVAQRRRSAPARPLTRWQRRRQILL